MAAPAIPVTTSVLDKRLNVASANVDFDANDQLLGTELLGVSKLLRSGVLPE